MPMKMKWGGKSGRYILTKDIYVLQIYLGEMPLLQCTMSSQSNAHHCMSYICEKVDLRQVDFFGFRFRMKHTDPDIKMWRWVDMNKPLMAQLNTYACKSNSIHLAIIFHTPNVFAIRDNTARTIYYTLLKADVLNGKYPEDVNKYLGLSALSLQVDCGDYDPSIHTLDYLRAQKLFPPDVLAQTSPHELDALLMKVAELYERHKSMDSAYAAFLYIVEVQQCHGYGEEYFPAKDDNGIEVRIGYSLDGIIVQKPGDRKIFAWTSIKTVAAHKRSLQLKYKNDAAAMSVFTMESVEMAKYVQTILNCQMIYATTTAIEHKMAPMSINNLRTFDFTGSNGLFRHSTADIRSLRPASSVDSFANNGNQCTVHSIPSANHPLLSTSLSCQRSVSSAGQLHIDNSTAITTAATKVSPVYRPPSTSSSHHRHQMVEQQAGSSPEIRALGISTTTASINARSQAFNSHLMRKAFKSPKNSSENNTTQSHIFTSTPNLHSPPSPKWVSTPEGLNATKGAAAARGKTRRRYTRLTQELHPMVLMAAAAQLTQKAATAHSSSGDSSNAATAVEENGQPPRTGYSQGRVIASALQSRSIGQSIVYPMPEQCGSSRIHNTAAPLSPPPPIPISPPALHYIPSPTMMMNSLTIDGGSKHLLLNGVVGQMSPHHNNNGGGDEAAKRRQKEFFTSSLMETSASSPNLPNDSSNSSSIEVHAVTDALLKDLTDKLSIGGAVALEYGGIPKKKLSAGYSTSQRSENQARNRQGNKVVPYEDNRVMLPPNKHNPDGYINASNITVPIDELRSLHYIVSQAPMRQNIQDWWEMCWESGARIIVMLVNPHKAHDNSPTYWPTKQKERMTIGPFVLKLVSSSTSSKCQTTSVLTLKSISRGERRTIYHLYYADFNQDGIPSSEDSFMEFVDAVSSVKRHVENERRELKRRATIINGSGSEAPLVNDVMHGRKERSRSIGRSGLIDISNRLRAASSTAMGRSLMEQTAAWRKKLSFSSSSSSAQNSSVSVGGGGCSGTAIFYTHMLPMSNSSSSPLSIVHCEDGASESGLFIMVECISKCIESNVNVEIAQVLRSLRQQRMSLVGNSAQYQFIYELIVSFLQKSRLI